MSEQLLGSFDATSSDKSVRRASEGFFEGAREMKTAQPDERGEVAEGNPLGQVVGHIIAEQPLLRVRQVPAFTCSEWRFPYAVPMGFQNGKHGQGLDIDIVDSLRVAECGLHFSKRRL